MKRNSLFLAFSLASTAMLSACGGNDDGDTVVITPSATPTPTVTAPPVVGDCADAVQASFVSFNNNCSRGTLEGVVDQDYTLTADVVWELKGPVLVGKGNERVNTNAAAQLLKDNGVTLTIEAGTDVKAYDDGSLFVTRGSKLMADGTAQDPITFSSLDSDYDGSSEWGGIVIQGFAPQYGGGLTTPCYADGEIFCDVKGEGGNTVGYFGGDDEADNSGVMRYVRIAEGGKVAGVNDELNGLTLQGVGHATTLEYIQVHGNIDDGVEWFGGTVNAKYLVLTNNDDDDIDFDEGYKGNIQYAIIQKDPLATAPTGSNDPRGIEANSDKGGHQKETKAVLANITIVGSEVNKANNSKDKGNQPGMVLRGSVGVDVYNTAVTNFTACTSIADTDSTGTDNVQVVESSVVNFTNVVGACDDSFYASARVADSATNVMQNSAFSLDANYAIQEAFAKVAATTITPVANGSSFSFDATDYIGAVDPDGVAWWQGWTLPGTLAVKPRETGFATCNDDFTTCTLEGLVDEDYTLVNGVEYLLKGEVLVGEGNVKISSASEIETIKNKGVTLTIQPGVHVKAFDDGSLLVTRGSKLNAIGTMAAPITFSSYSDADLDGMGEWGGVILQGFAPQYGQKGTGACYGADTWCNVEGEGGTVVGHYGGNEPADNSGTLKFVRIAEGGKIAGPNNEINGLTLQGVGHKTTLEYIQVHGNLDDGVEWFGGTVNAKYLVLTGNDDDDIDFDEGYQGNIQYAIIRKDPNATGPQGSNDPRGIEANSANAKYAPETNAALANILLWGSEVNKALNAPDSSGVQTGGNQPGMVLQGALTTSLYNTAVKNFTTCVRIDDAEVTSGVTESSNVTLVNILGECDDMFYANLAADSETGTVGANTVTVDSAYALTDAAATVTEVNPVEVDNGSGFMFENTSYVGAVAPGTSKDDAWWAGWTIPGSL